ncbi:hypothetical protein ABK040_010254 [Willaertia magna]
MSKLAIAFFFLTIIGSIFSQQTVQFFECPLFTSFSFPENISYLDPKSLGAGGASLLPFINAINELNAKYNSTIRTKAECAKVPLPINYEDENSPTINIFVKRLRFNTNQDAKKALWLLQGGPGDSSEFFELPMDILIKALEGDFDIYTLDHRGVGRSNRLTCVSSQAETLGSDGGYTITLDEWKYCGNDLKVENGDNLQRYSSLGAAVDVVKLIQSINVPKNQDTFIYGLSYGTIWVTRILRYLELNNLNNLLKGAIIDGIVSTKNKKYTIDMLDLTSDMVGEMYLNLCNKTIADKDNVCAEKLDTDNPVQYMKDVINGVYGVNNTSTCRPIREGIPKDVLRRIFGIMIADVYSRPLIPAVLYRLNRCDEDMDIPFILHIGNIFTELFSLMNSGTTLPLLSPSLQTNIVLSEIWNPDITIDEIRNETETLYFALGPALQMAEIKEASNYPTYNLDPKYFNEAFTTNIPVLLLNGELDPQTPLWSAKEQNENIGGNSHGLISIPFAPHATLVFSEQKNTSISCGMELIINFIKMENPDVSKIDRKCLNNLNFNFTGSPLVNQLRFDCYNIYEDTYTPDNGPSEVSLYLFVGVEGATICLSIIIICSFIYYLVELKDKRLARLQALENYQQ